MKNNEKNLEIFKKLWKRLIYIEIYEIFIPEYHT